jgi:arylsulfatase A-like enzyme
MQAMMNRRECLGLLAAAAWPAATRPNFVFLFADDMRWDTIAALGNKQIRTPNLDRLAARGVAFTNAYIMGGTMGAVCSPSRAMLLTGQNLFHIRRLTSPPDEQAPERPFHMWPEELRKAGYTTWGTGKWHNPPALHARCFSQGANVFLGGMGDQNAMPLRPFSPTGEYAKTPPIPGKGNATEIFAGGAVEFIRSYREAAPFAAYIAFTSPHDPRTAPRQYHEIYPAAKTELPANFQPEHPFDNGAMKLRDEMLAAFPRTREEVSRHIADYHAMITHLDAQVGRVMDAVEASPHAKNTILVFAGDNGLAIGSHGLMGKQNVYEHSVRVPLMLAGPGIPAAERREGFCYLHDLCPTILELAGVAVPSTVEARSLVPLMRNAKSPGRESIFCAYRHLHRSVRTRDWKLIRYNVEGTRTQLFHVSEDPAELRDLSGRPEHAKQVAALERLLERWMRDTDDPLL